MIYEVKNGDTLSKIAKENGTTVDEILKYNNISNPNQIYPNQKLTIGSPSVKLQIVDAVMRPIESLEVKLHFNNQEMCYISDSNGWLPEITLVKTNDSIKIEVKKITGEYKALGTVLAGTKAKKVTVQSPNVVFKAKTMPEKSSTTSASRPTVSENKTVHTAQTVTVNQIPTHYAIASNHAPWVEIAKTQLGTKEIPGSATHPHIAEYYRAAGIIKVTDAINKVNDGSIPWCGCFVAWVMKKAGHVPVKNSAGARFWKNFGKAIDRPVYGAIAIKSRNGGGHVAIVIGQDKSGKRLFVIGGNQSDKVSITSYPKSVWSAYRVPIDFNSTNATLPIYSGESHTGGRES